LPLDGHEERRDAAPTGSIKDQEVGGSIQLARHKKSAPNNQSALRGTPRGSRTPNLLIRSQVLYPIELAVLNTENKESDLFAFAWQEEL
jgi:hypothetical protein